MSNFHETTAAGFSKRAERAYVQYMDGGPVDLLNKAEWFEKQAAKHCAEALAQAAKQPQTTQSAPVVAAEKNGRCPHYKLIRRFFAIAREAGLDTSEAARPVMRRAMEKLMGRCVKSRSEVAANEWWMLAEAVRVGRLAWQIEGEACIA